MIMLVAKPNYFLQSASNGLLLFATSVLPAIFPFFFCSTLLTAIGAARSVSKLGAKPVRTLFNAPPEGAYVLALSLLSGYPIGAATVADLYTRGAITRDEAKKIASFTSTSGPIFVLGTVGSAVFGSPAYGAVILLSHYLAAFVTGIVFRGRRQQSERTEARLLAADTDNLLAESISSSTLSMLAVGGYIVLANMLIDALALTGIGDLIAAIPNGEVSSVLRALLTGLVEMTRGSMMSKEIGNLPLALACACGTVSFGGLSVIAQTLTFLGRCGMGFGAVLIRKAVQSCAAFLLCLMFSHIFFTLF